MCFEGLKGLGCKERRVFALRDASRAGGEFGHDAALRAFYKRAESGRGDGVRKVQRSSLAFLRRELGLLFSFLGRIKADKDLSWGGTRPYFPGLPEKFLIRPLFCFSGWKRRGALKNTGLILCITFQIAQAGAAWATRSAAAG